MYYELIIWMNKKTAVVMQNTDTTANLPVTILSTCSQHDMFKHP